jgi:hypothetical protein
MTRLWHRACLMFAANSTDRSMAKICQCTLAAQPLNGHDMTKEATTLDCEMRDDGMRDDGRHERVVGDQERRPIFLAGEDANLRSRTPCTVAAAILFMLPIDEPLRKEYLLRRWRCNDS